MLDNYNKHDYELLLKRARIRQFQMKYEEALLDANFALQILPQRLDAYYMLSDFFLAQNNYSEALKFLEILHQHDPTNQMIKGEYEQIREKEKKKQNKAQAFRNKSKYDGKTAFTKASVETHPKLFTEDYQSQIGAELRQYQSFEKSFEDDMVLSDELEEGEDHSSEREKPGNFQQYETPRILQQIDFRQVTWENLYSKKKEIFKMKDKKVQNIDCQLCKLIFDYTSTCQHYSQLKTEDMDNLQDLIPGIQGQKDINAKKQALQKVTKSLDVLSTFKRDLSKLLGDNSENVCLECCVINTDQYQKPILSLAEHALILVNRSLTFQIQAQMLNEKEDLINVGGLEEDKADFEIHPKIAQSIIEEAKLEFKSIQNKSFKELNFQSLHFLIRALTNVLILSAEQTPILNQLRHAGIIKKMLEILNSAPTDLFKDKRNKASHFCMFLTHSLRFFILCTSIDPKCVTQFEEPSLKQVVRKYQLYDKLFPMNAPLINALKTDFLWFKHSNSGCFLKDFYNEESLVKECGNCGKQSCDLKVCSRCLKIYYCNKDCQKSHYAKHKNECAKVNQ